MLNTSNRSDEALNDDESAESPSGSAEVLPAAGELELIKSEQVMSLTKLYPLKTIEILRYYHKKSFSQGQTGAARSAKKKRKKGGTKPTATAPVEEVCL